MSFDRPTLKTFERLSVVLDRRIVSVGCVETSKHAGVSDSAGFQGKHRKQRTRHSGNRNRANDAIPRVDSRKTFRFNYTDRRFHCRYTARFVVIFITALLRCSMARTRGAANAPDSLVASFQASLITRISVNEILMKPMD